MFLKFEYICIRVLFRHNTFKWLISNKLLRIKVPIICVLLLFIIKMVNTFIFIPQSEMLIQIGIVLNSNRI